MSTEVSKYKELDIAVENGLIFEDALLQFGVTREEYFTEEARIMNSGQGIGEQFELDWIDLDPQHPSQIRIRSRIVEKVVEEEIFPLEEALQLYVITEGQYKEYLKNKNHEIE
jgi:hypothetical protein